MTTTCRHCARVIVNEEGSWIDPEATDDDSVWRETCDSHDTFTAEHEPLTIPCAACGAEASEDCFPGCIGKAAAHDAAEAFRLDAISLLAGFEFELCSDCGKDADRHVIASDMLGKAHLYCLDEIDPVPEPRPCRCVRRAGDPHSDDCPNRV